MKKAIDFFTAHPARFFLLAALLWGGLMCLISIIRGKFDLDGLLVEANGMVFDLLVFGVLLSIYEALREKRDKIERLHEEIDDYRGWDEKEAMFRIVGAVRRLNKLGVSKIELRNCFLQRANLFEVNLQEANLLGANLQEANLQEANLQGAELWSANLQGTKLSGANLQGTKLSGANLQEAKLWSANLQGAKIWKTNLQGARLEGANLERAIVDENWFEKLEQWQVIDREEIKQKYLIDENGVLREKQ